jgi:hypothetical protein
MRGGSYGNLLLDDDARPASEISFITYPSEQVLFGDVRFEGAANLHFDGNEDNRVRAAAGPYPDGAYGLWFRGTGVTGFNIPAVPSIMIFSEVNGPTSWNENITFSNFRIGDSMSTNESNWRAQQGFEFGPYSRNIVFEDFQLSYLGADLRDFDPEDGAGDDDGGGLGSKWFQASNTNYGNFTFRRGHFAHLFNDVFHYGPNGADPARVRIENCLVEEITNYGDAHADMFQIFGGGQRLEVEGTVFRTGTDFMFHGDASGRPRLFTNCLIGDPNGTLPNINNFTLSKDNEGGPAATFELRSCTLHYANSLRCDSTSGASYTRANVLSHNIYRGISSTTGINRNNFFAGGNEGSPNLLVTGSPGITGDVTGTPTYNSQGECTSHTQGWRKPVDFPWTL